MEEKGGDSTRLLLRRTNQRLGETLCLMDVIDCADPELFDDPPDRSIGCPLHGNLFRSEPDQARSREDRRACSMLPYAGRSAAIALKSAGSFHGASTRQVRR